jgi:hypothetical protein
VLTGRHREAVHDIVEIGNVTMAPEPFGSLALQGRNLFGPRAAQLQPEQVREQQVIPEPGALRIQRHDERVRLLQLKQEAVGARAAGQQISQLTVDAIEDGGAHKQLLHVSWLAVERLCEQVLGHRALAAGELRSESPRLGVTGQGQGGEP